jgi:Tol biopolymer transport system component
VTDPPDRLRVSLSDRYRLDGELGQGGMATVYLAHDLKHDRKVALKVLRPELGAVLGAERFLREIQLTAKLQHPHILPLLDSGEATGLFFYVMPYVEGESLRQRLEREKQLSLEEALRLTSEVAEALDYAHQQGVIHRDIKPENILLSRGHALVADFGIALAVTQAGGGRLTETGLSLGTPAYMSPEQAMAEADLDGRTDQYGLACVLYEMLAGEPPYTGPTAQAIVAKRLREPVPHLSTIREVPAGVEAAVTRALAKARVDRFSTAGEFRRALLAPAPRAPPRLPRPVTALLAVLLVIGVVGGARALLHRAPPPPAVHRQLTFTGDAGYPTISPDGRWLAYVRGSGGEAPHLLIQDLGSSGPPLIVASPWSMRRWVGWNLAGDTLYLVADRDSADSGTRILALPRGGGAMLQTAWPNAAVDLSPRGDTIYRLNDLDYPSVVTDTMSVIATPSGALVRRFTLGLDGLRTGARISPDARWLAAVFIRGNATFLCLISTDGKLVRRLVERVPRFTSLAWNRGSSGIYYLRDLGNGANLGAGLDLMKVVIDHRTGLPRGEPRVVVGGASIRDFATVPDRNLLVYTKAPPNQKLWAMNLGPRGQVASARVFDLGTGVIGTPDVSPDGRWVAYAQNDRGLGKLFATPFDSSAPRALPTPSADAWSPRWSPDGKSVAYASTDPQSPGVFLLEPAFGGQARQVTSSGMAPAGRLSWSPDGNTLMFPVDLGRHYALVDVNSGRADTLVSPRMGAVHLSAFSPEGREVTIGATYLVRGPRTGEKWDSLATPASVDPLLWARDGWIYFGHLIWHRAGVDDPVGFREIWRTRAEATRAELYARLPEVCSWWEISVSDDARRLVCTVSKSEPDIWIAEHFDPEEN